MAQAEAVLSSGGKKTIVILKIEFKIESASVVTTMNENKRSLFKSKKFYILVIMSLLVAGGVSIGLYLYRQSQQPKAVVVPTVQVAKNDTLQLPSFINTTAIYTPPTSATKYVSNDGSDSANGDSVAAPYKTICKAIASTGAGGSIILRGGVYREGSGGDGGCGGYKVGKKINIQSYKDERAWVKGSLIANNWQADGANRWKTSWPYLSNLESTVPEANRDAIGPSNPLGGDAAMVFINGMSLKQVGSLAAVTTGTFYADRSSKTLHIGTNPSGNTVEATAFPRFIYFTSSATGSTVSGVGFAQFGSSWNQSTNPGALLLQAESIKLDNTVFSQNAAWGVAMISGKQTLRNSVLSYNGHDGVLGNRMDGSVLENNVFDRNNTEKLGTEACSASCTAAGVKIAHSDGLTIRNNTFSNNSGYGFWCDLTCQNLTFVNNTSHSNSKAGIFYEVSSVAIIASNLIYDNKTSGIRIAGSDRVRIYNNTLVNNGVNANGLESAIGIYDDTRAPEPYGQARGVTWNTSQVEIVNNLMAYNTASPFIDIRKSAQVSAESMISKMSSNAYYRKSTSQPSIVIRRAGASQTNATTLSAAVNAKIESSQSISNDTNGALFTGKAYAVDSSSAVYQRAETIPADILSAIGNPAGPYSIGYLGSSQLTVPGTPPTVPVDPSDPNVQPAPAPAPPVADPSAPSVKVTAPSQSEQVKGVYILKADASDNKAVSKVEFYVNGYLIGADTVAPYQVGWTSTLAKDGTYPVTAIAYDAAGNKTVSSPVTVTSKNTVSLDISLTQPTDNQTIGANGKYPLKADVSGSAKVTKVEFYVNGYSIGADASAPYQVYWNNTGVTNGKYPVVAKAYVEDGRVVVSKTVTINLKK